MIDKIDNRILKSSSEFGRSMYNLQKTNSFNVQIPCSYLIYKSSGTIYAKNGTTGMIDYSGRNAVTVIQNAYDNIYNTGGGTLCIKKGSYDIEDTVQLKKDVNICGEGYGTLLTNNVVGGPVFEFINADQGVNLHTIIEKVRFIGGGTGTGSAIQTISHTGNPYTLTERICFRDLWIEDMKSHGINMPSRVDMALFENIFILRCAGNGIHSNYKMAGCTIIGCDLSENTGNGLYSEHGTGNYINLEQVAANSQYGAYLKDELGSKIELQYSENNAIKGLYLAGLGCRAEMGNVTDGYTITGNNSYSIGHIMYPIEENPYQSKPSYLWVHYAIRPKVTTNVASFPLQKYVDGNYVNVASIGNGAFDIYNLRTHRKDYGGNFSTFVPPTPQGIGHCFFAQDLNVSNPGKRLYNSFDGSTWNYINFQ